LIDVSDVLFLRGPLNIQFCNEAERERRRQGAGEGHIGRNMAAGCNEVYGDSQPAGVKLPTPLAVA